MMRHVFRAALRAEHAVAGEPVAQASFNSAWNRFIRSQGVTLSGGVTAPTAVVSRRAPNEWTTV